MLFCGEDSFSPHAILSKKKLGSGSLHQTGAGIRKFGFDAVIAKYSETVSGRQFNKYGSIQELCSTFIQFYFVLVMFQLGSE